MPRAMGTAGDCGKEGFGRRFESHPLQGSGVARLGEQGGRSVRERHRPRFGDQRAQDVAGAAGVAVGEFAGREEPEPGDRADAAEQVVAAGQPT